MFQLDGSIGFWVYLLRLRFVFILIIRCRSSQSGHLVDDPQSSKLVEKNISTFIHKIPDDLQSQEVAVVVVLTNTKQVSPETLHERLIRLHFTCLGVPHATYYT